MLSITFIILFLLIILIINFFNKNKIQKKYIPLIENNIKDKILVDLINDYRKNLNLQILKSEKLLISLAKKQVLWLNENVKNKEDFEIKGHYFLNERQSSSNIDDKDVNYGEITCYGYVSEKSKLQAYLKSKLHKECIENPNFNYIGSATVNNINFIIFTKY